VHPDRLESLYREHLTRLATGYADALATHGYDAVVLHAGAPVKRTGADDQYWPLRPTPHFQHWLALAEPGCALVVAPGRKPMLLRPLLQSFWERPFAPAWEGALAFFDTRTFPEDGEPLAELPSRARLAFVGDAVGVAARWGIHDANVNPSPLVAALDALRTHKTPYEVACLLEANRLAAAGHDAVRARFVAGGASELDLHLAYLGATAQDDPETPYKNIVAMGTNAAILHHVSYGRSTRTREAESLLLDAGATYLGYCSDITRTWVRGSGAAASGFAGLVERVEVMQRSLCADAKPGLPYEELHDECHRRLGVALCESGIVRGSAEEAVQSGVTRAFLPHGLGHSLGLQCHDVGCALTRPRPDNPFLRNTSVISAGQTFTIEPGVYFIDALLAPLRGGPHASLVDWRTVDGLAPFGGIRIEDDLHVLPGAPAENLTRPYLPIGGAAV
jgi:Xaa-Pro dipeptidase